MGTRSPGKSFHQQLPCLSVACFLSGLSRWPQIHKSPARASKIIRLAGLGPKEYERWYRLFIALNSGHRQWAVITKKSGTWKKTVSRVKGRVYSEVKIESDTTTRSTTDFRLFVLFSKILALPNRLNKAPDLRRATKTFLRLHRPNWQRVQRNSSKPKLEKRFTTRTVHKNMQPTNHPVL